MQHVWKGLGKMMKKNLEMWWSATYTTTLLDNPEACYEINQEIVGCLHTLASIGSGLNETHFDPGYAGWEWGGLPAFHVNLMWNDNIGLVVYVPTGEKRVRPVIVVQEIMACMYFYGKKPEACNHSHWYIPKQIQWPLQKARKGKARHGYSWKLVKAGHRHQEQSVRDILHQI